MVTILPQVAYLTRVENQSFVKSLLHKEKKKKIVNVDF